MPAWHGDQGDSHVPTTSVCGDGYWSCSQASCLAWASSRAASPFPALPSSPFSPSPISLLHCAHILPQSPLPTFPFHHTHTSPLHHPHTSPLHHPHTSPLHHPHTSPLHHPHTSPLHHPHTSPLHHPHTSPVYSALLLGSVSIYNVCDGIYNVYLYSITMSSCTGIILQCTYNIVQISG